jgi:hypothetical protein
MTGLMSNAKWKKLLTQLATADAARHCTWKLLQWQEPRPGVLPAADCLTENGVGDCGVASGGPFKFSEIEWLFIPAKAVRWPKALAHNTFEEQDIRKVQALVEALGMYPYEITNEGLKVSGYAP